jgi:hypothetical protein
VKAILRVDVFAQKRKSAVGFPNGGVSVEEGYFVEAG